MRTESFPLLASQIQELATVPSLTLVKQKCWVGQEITAAVSPCLVQPFASSGDREQNKWIYFTCGQFCCPSSGERLAQLMRGDFATRTEHSLPSLWHFKMCEMQLIKWLLKISLDSYINHFFFLFERPEWQFIFKCCLEWEGIFSDKLLAVQELCPSVHFSKSFDRSWGYSFQ